MPVNKENIPRINFHIKLLAGNNVVLLEADKYESECFIPHVMNGRITFINIIPNRRCCNVTDTNGIQCARKEFRETLLHLKKENVVMPRKLKRTSGQLPTMGSPLANSTPAGVKQCKGYSDEFVNSNYCLTHTHTALPTPEPVRKALPACLNLLEKSIPDPQSLRVSRIYTNSTHGTPKKIGRLLMSSNGYSMQNLANSSIINGSFKILCSPATSSQTKRSKENMVDSTFLGSVSGYKVLTPVRTYTRRSKKPIFIQRPVSCDSAKKSFKTSRFKPTYLVNPTQAPKVSKIVEIKKRKLIIDNKTSISPITFKKQQKGAIEPSKYKSKTVHSWHLNFHKLRPNVESIKMSAFDLLTNTNRFMSSKLNEQFRKGCVNKASSTYSKYKILSTVPPLQQDEQVLELQN